MFSHEIYYRRGFFAIVVINDVQLRLKIELKCRERFQIKSFCFEREIESKIQNGKADETRDESSENQADFDVGTKVSLMTLTFLD